MERACSVTDGGIKLGIVYGEADEFSCNIVRDPVHMHDFNATILRTLEIDHGRLTFRTQGRDFRLTDVGGGGRRRHPRVGGTSP